MYNLQYKPGSSVYDSAGECWNCYNYKRQTRIRAQRTANLFFGRRNYAHCLNYEFYKRIPAPNLSNQMVKLWTNNKNNWKKSNNRLVFAFVWKYNTTI